MIEEGIIKFFLAPNGTRKEWIISRDAMFVWFGEPRISKEWIISRDAMFVWFGEPRISKE
ncbi:hypothetical protein ACWKTS_32990 [Bacillus toyonensis]